ncbi:MAG TPA: hypothetical protein VLY24_17805 [Bryobacteraceae bacterium]|nr:hypothetical protein [Bryobacteraceae bacterium]
MAQPIRPAPSWYLDLLLLDTYFEGHRYHHTASATMFYALREGLALIAEEGLEARWERHRSNRLAFVAGIETMGLRMRVPEGQRQWALNTPRVPDGIDEAKVRKYLLEERLPIWDGSISGRSQFCHLDEIPGIHVEHFPKLTRLIGADRPASLQRFTYMALLAKYGN